MDALGEFRLEGLYAGEFFVIALPCHPPVDASGRPARTGFGNTFYPGVRAFADAKIVVVRPGSRTRKAPQNTETGLAAGFAPFSRRKRGD